MSSVHLTHFVLECGNHYLNPQLYLDLEIKITIIYAMFIGNACYSVNRTETVVDDIELNFCGQIAPILFHSGDNNNNIKNDTNNILFYEKKKIIK